AFATQRPAHHPFEREWRLEQALLVAADHALGDVVTQLFELAGEPRLAARPRAVHVSLTQLAQAGADAALDRRPPSDLDFIAITHLRVWEHSGWSRTAAMRARHGPGKFGLPE